MATYWKELQKVLNDLDKIQRTFSRELAAKAERDLTDAHQSIIAEFYAKHDPSSYHRRSAGLDQTILYHKSRHGNRAGIYRAKVRIGSADMGPHGNREDISADNVFDLVWNRGIRGLPYMGSEPLSKDIRWLGHYFAAGDRWRNPFWSAEGDPYHNIYRAKYHADTGTTREGTPDQVMADIVNRWGELSGSAYADKIADSLRESL